VTRRTSEVPEASAVNTINVSYNLLAEVEFTGGKIVKVVFDVADDAYVDLEHELTAALARD
jgi:hypothetical protein